MSVLAVARVLSCWRERYVQHAALLVDILSRSSPYKLIPETWRISLIIVEPSGCCQFKWEEIGLSDLIIIDSIPICRFVLCPQFVRLLLTSPFGKDQTWGLSTHIVLSSHFFCFLCLSCSLYPIQIGFLNKSPRLWKRLSHVLQKNENGCCYVECKMCSPWDKGTSCICELRYTFLT